MDIGEKIKSLRLENNLTQEELASRCDLSKGFISLVERNLTSPSIATLIDILDTLGTDLNKFFSEKENEKIVFTPDDIFENQNSEMGHKIAWLISNSQKNNMEPIIVKISAKGVFADEDAHEGEEFGYVIKGKIKLLLNNRNYVVNRGESYYFSSNCKHKIYNPYGKEATLLTVSTPPSF